MSNQRYTPEFKEEAVRQVLEKNHSVPTVAERLGVSAHSLYKWINAVKPDKSEAQANELLLAKQEVLKLRAELRRAQEERDRVLPRFCGHFREARYWAKGVSLWSREGSTARSSSAVLWSRLNNLA
jgi:transposase